MNPRWWQFVTSIFCHANWAHLSGNIFFLYIFGKIVEEEEGAFGVWFSYLFTGVGAGLASYLVLPRGSGGLLGVGASATVSLGASGAVFGLFAISVLTKLTRPSLRKLLEAIILGQFVVERFLSEAKMATAAGGVGAEGSITSRTPPARSQASPSSGCSRACYPPTRREHAQMRT